MDKNNIADGAKCRPSKLTTVEGSPAEGELEKRDSLVEWLRLPAPGERCPYFGFSRGSYNDLIFADPPKIQSVVVKKSEASRGIRLVRVSSVRAYLNSLVEEQNQKSEGGAS